MNCFSQLFHLKPADWWRGLIVATLTTPLTLIYTSTSAGKLTFDWQAILAAAITGFIAYMAKNFMTGSGGQLLKNDPPQTGS